MVLQQWARESHYQADSTWKHEIILFATSADRSQLYVIHFQKSLFQKADLPRRNTAMQGTTVDFNRVPRW